MKKLELWARRLSKRNFDAFQNLKTFLESADEELSNSLEIFYPASARFAMQFSRVLSTSR
jgi:hypothetical protein